MTIRIKLYITKIKFDLIQFLQFVPHWLKKLAKHWTWKNNRKSICRPCSGWIWNVEIFAFYINIFYIAFKSWFSFISFKFSLNTEFTNITRIVLKYWFDVIWGIVLICLGCLIGSVLYITGCINVVFIRKKYISIRMILMKYDYN